VRFKAIGDEVGDVFPEELDHGLLLPPHQIQPSPGAFDRVLAFVVELGVEQAVKHLVPPPPLPPPPPALLSLRLPLLWLAAGEKTRESERELAANGGVKA